GPTAVINASLGGVIVAAQQAGYAKVLGMRHGVLGILRDDLVDLTNLDDERLYRLKRTPSSALGSCRYKLQPGDAERIAQLCQREGVEAFIYIGGNDSADTSQQIATAAGQNLHVVGVTKTTDND